MNAHSLILTAVCRWKFDGVMEDYLPFAVCRKWAPTNPSKMALQMGNWSENILYL